MVWEENRSNATAMSLVKIEGLHSAGSMPRFIRPSGLTLAQRQQPYHKAGRERAPNTHHTSQT
jgi:hypothetical protein